MRIRNLLKDYPDLLQVVQENDCGFSEAIEIIECQKEKEGLMRWMIK